MTEYGKSMVQEMRYFDDGSVAARSGSHWLVWEPCGGLDNARYVAPWKDCEARRFIDKKQFAITRSAAKILSRAWLYLHHLMLKFFDGAVRSQN